MKAIERIKKALEAANGSRQARLLTIDMIMSCLRRAKRNGFEKIHGGHVANNYKYQASATAAFAIRRNDGKILLVIGVANASPGHHRPNNTPFKQLLKECPATENAATAIKANEKNGIFVLTRMPRE